MVWLSPSVINCNFSEEAAVVRKTEKDKGLAAGILAQIAK